MTNIHKTAVVSRKSNIDPSVAIGAYSIIGDDVEIGKNTKIESHVVIKGKTKISFPGQCDNGQNNAQCEFVAGNGDNFRTPGSCHLSGDI